MFSAAAISYIESSRDDRAPTSVTSDKKHGSSGYASLIAEINALDFSDDVASVVSDTIGEHLVLSVIVSSCVTSTLNLIKTVTQTHSRTSADMVVQGIISIHLNDNTRQTFVFSKYSLLEHLPWGARVSRANLDQTMITLALMMAWQHLMHDISNHSIDIVLRVELLGHI